MMVATKRGSGAAGVLRAPGYGRRAGGRGDAREQGNAGGRTARLIRARAVAAAAVTAALAALATAPAGAATAGMAAGGGPGRDGVAPGCIPAGPPAGTGLTLAGSSQLDARAVQLTFDSTAMGGAARADVLLPSGYTPTRRYPVLYLLHGGGGSAGDWLTLGDAEDIVGVLPLIVVMPEGGADGWYSDWYGTVPGTPGPAPAWESFHIDELIPWIDAHYATIADRSGRAIAGVSMGGYGAMEYAARYPDLFSVAGSFSGAVDLDYTSPGGWAVPALAWLVGDTPPATCAWGDPVLQRMNIEGHDPTALADNLHSVHLFVASGNGLDGPYDTTPNPEASAIEAGANLEGEGFTDALSEAGVAVTTSFYGPGTHTWPYWQADLRAFLTFLQASWAAPLPAPPGVPFSYRSTAAAFSAWGWSFAVAGRNLPAFTDLTDVTSGGLTIRGGGTVTVTTPPVYQPRSAWTVQAGPAPAEAVTADAEGRLTFTVALGPVPLANYLAALTAPYPSDPATSTAQITIQPATTPSRPR
jgi:S-formylglutathione hydrolase FrmB